MAMTNSMKRHIERAAPLYGYKMDSVKEKKDGSIVIYLTEEEEKPLSSDDFSKNL